MKRPALFALVPALLSWGCTARILQYDGSRPPLDQETRVEITRTFQGGYGQPKRFAYVDIADHADLPEEGTIELSNSPFAMDQNESDSCDDSFLNGTLCIACYLGCMPVAFAAALFYLPYLAATGQLHGDSSEVAPSPSEQEAGWLASVVEDRQWSSDLDEAYILGLGQALGWATLPADGEAERQVHQPDGGHFPVQHQSAFSAGISRIVVLNSSSGERTLLLCSRSTIQLRRGAGPRTFETCQRGGIDAGMLENSPASGDALRAMLVERAKLLSVVQARQLCPGCTARQ